MADNATEEGDEKMELDYRNADMIAQDEQDEQDEREAERLKRISANQNTNTASTEPEIFKRLGTNAGEKKNVGLSSSSMETGTGLQQDSITTHTAPLTRSTKIYLWC